MNSEEEEQFFDTRDEVASTFDSYSDCANNWEFDAGIFDASSGIFLSENWIGNLNSVYERRHNFLKWIGVSADWIKSEQSNREGNCSETVIDMDRILENGETVLANALLDNHFSSYRSSMSNLSNEASDLHQDRVVDNDFACRIRNLGDGSEFILVNELSSQVVFDKFRDIGSDKVLTIDEFQKTTGSSSFVQRFMRREVGIELNSNEMVKRSNKEWIKRSNQGEPQTKAKAINSNVFANTKFCRIQVKVHKKNLKEFSSVYMGQQIQAHKGSIFTMKFSLDGKYLASAGEDGIVRVWEVIELSQIDEGDISHLDHSHSYVTVNYNSELAPFFMSDKKQKDGLNAARKTTESTYVAFPSGIFHISETPLQEFHGHNGNVLDISWWRNQCLLSCSDDKTVRLWKVGSETCVKNFPHSDFVTCIQVNPCNDDYFISGSLDGKVRIWAISSCRVVNWTSISDIITALTYFPDGKGGIIGCMSGSCHFFSAEDDDFQLTCELSLLGKKKYPSNRITGFQICPNDPTKIMVTSGDSLVRILMKDEIICKYKGMRNMGSQIHASFTSDGKHIISASENSHVYIWNFNNQGQHRSKPSKSIRSCERFFSAHSSVAIAWPRTSSVSIISKKNSSGHESNANIKSPHLNSFHNSMEQSSPHCFPVTMSKASATWPEEKLPKTRKIFRHSIASKFRHKFLKNSCQDIISAHALGVVIVTASYDGLIRSFLNYGLPVRL